MAACPLTREEARVGGASPGGDGQDGLEEEVLGDELATVAILGDPDDLGDLEDLEGVFVGDLGGIPGGLAVDLVAGLIALVLDLEEAFAPEKCHRAALVWPWGEVTREEARWPDSTTAVGQIAGLAMAVEA